MLNVKQLTYLHSSNAGVSGISFDLQKGEHLAVIGESGCGKSTLIKALYGLFDLDKGKIFWNGEPVLGPAYNLVPGFSKFKHLSQEFDLMPFTTTEENIQKFLSRETPIQNQQRSDELIELFDLEEVKHQKVKTLSGGQKQRVAIAQALAKPPELILLDEPFSHIDQFLKPKLRRRLFEFLKQENISCVFATHDADDVLPFSDSTMVLKSGTAIDYRPTKEVYNQPKNHYCASLFGDLNMIDAKQFNIKSNVQHIIVYPHEMQLVKDKGFTAKVKSSYFKGSHFLLEVVCAAKNYYIHSETYLKKGCSINFEIDLAKIEKRLN